MSLMSSAGTGSAHGRILTSYVQRARRVEGEIKERIGKQDSGTEYGA